ncbi:MAG: RelA/SpoT family protein [Bacteroidales bacterium]
MTDDYKKVESVEDQLIEQEFQELLNDYLNSNHRKKVEIITKAFLFAKNAHAGMRRKSGEAYIFHPIAVARIVAKEMGLGSTSIVSALLHDVVEDTEYTVEDIRMMFGDKVAEIVEGLTKIAGGIFGDKTSSQAENFRRLLLTMAKDVRVILIKMADRLHNMRTLSYMTPAKQYKIAGETLYLYAPLAHRLGLFAIKTELEDLSFKYEHPEIYESIKNKIAETASERSRLYHNFADPIIDKLDGMELHYDMKERVKSVYSIWQKMQKKNIPFEEVYDLYAVRIIFQPRDGNTEKQECWNIYNVITGIYMLHPDRIRDWVNRPKANGYQALHCTVMGPNGQWIEVQIRSQRMDDIAERGFAAHFHYKNVGMGDENRELDKWLETVKVILENPEPVAMDFLDTIKLNLFVSEIFVFTPKGEMKMMPLGATALDFAYLLHTDIGNHCIGAKVNHKLVPYSYKLQSGDQVEILTSKAQRIKEEWLSFVITPLAKNKINGELRKRRRSIITEGEKLVEDFVKKSPDPNALIVKIIDSFGFTSKEDLFYRVGNKNLILDNTVLDKVNGKKSFLRSLLPSFIPLGSDGKKEYKNSTVNPQESIDKKKDYLLTEVECGKQYHLMTCCNPIPGDEVLGYINTDGIVEVHKRQCEVAMRLKSSYGKNLLNTQWGDFKKKSFPVTILIDGIDGMGVLFNIANVLTTEMTANMQSVHIETKDGIFEGYFSVYVHNVDEVNALCKRLLGVKNLRRAVRKED